VSTENYINFQSDLQYIKGIGPKRAETLVKENIKLLYDLLYHFPRRYLDRSTVCKIAELNSSHQDIEVTVVGTVLSGEYIRKGRRGFYQLLISDDSGTVKCTWFNAILIMIS
jgi:ATP-dependent DNA helicase RecG